MDLRKSFVFSIHCADIRSGAMKTLLKLATSIFGENGASSDGSGTAGRVKGAGS
jgi:hypothetical protein